MQSLSLFQYFWFDSLTCFYSTTLFPLSSLFGAVSFIIHPFYSNVSLSFSSPRLVPHLFSLITSIQYSYVFQSLLLFLLFILPLSIFLSLSYRSYLWSLFHPFYSVLSFTPKYSPSFFLYFLYHKCKFPFTFSLLFPIYIFYFTPRFLCVSVSAFNFCLISKDLYLTIIRLILNPRFWNHEAKCRRLVVFLADVRKHTMRDALCLTRDAFHRLY
ncbi:unnamed protein product [Acanthosepion pharaonis]|uniref:Uncharacterized protein n=1 Tax=Acanthosepion pharaonis TaxID=158019 RepID=A0A812ARL5_ACAPH|nr:unnamed protein product [Sepia pharaonis]